jgi:Ca-activated chloride channel family protein
VQRIRARGESNPFDRLTSADPGEIIVIRHRTLAALAAALMLALAVVASARAQENRPRRVGDASDAASAPDEPVALDGTLVDVPVVVADRAGRYVPSLVDRDFELYEDGVLQRIVFFRNERVPIHVAILLDTSSSTRDSLGDIQDAAIEFTHLLLAGDQIAVVSFDGDVRVEQEFTNDRGRLVRAIKRTETRRGTRLYDAVYETMNERFRDVEGRKAIVLLSDGDDTRSDRSFEDAIGAVVESDVLVYGIRYPDGSGGWGLPIPHGGKKKDKNKGFHIPHLPGLPKIPGVGWPLAWTGGGSGGDFMDAVTSSSGGKLYEARTVHDFRGLFAEIAEELRHVYVLAYEPTNPVGNGGYRRVEVRVPAQPDLVVRHRLGYQAKPRP